MYSTCLGAKVAFEDPSLGDEVSRRYFPEMRGFETFGDPFERKNEYLKEQKELERRRQEAEAERLAELERAALGMGDPADKNPSSSGGLGGERDEL